MKYIILLLMVMMIPTAYALEIESPTAQDYFGNVEVLITEDKIVDSINYSIGEFNQSCENCSNISQTLELESGTYELIASSYDGENQTSKNVTFTVLENLTIVIKSPMAGNNTNPVLINFSTNSLSNLTYNLDGNETVVCDSCSQFSTSKNLSIGNHTLTVLASNQFQSVNKTLKFRVVNLTNVTIEPDNSTNTTNNETEDESDDEEYPRFTLGLNKLPQALEAGELTDEELAQIIRNNRLNPGVTNRLIKTGLLGDESIDAIIETQKTPPGIFKKILGFFGFEVKTAKEELIEEYNLSSNQKVKLITDQDISEETVEELKEDIKRVPPGQQKKIASVQAQVVNQETNTQIDNSDEDNKPGFTPPGLEKKGKIPPGQAKKNGAFNAGKQNGKK